MKTSSRRSRSRSHSPPAARIPTAARLLELGRTVLHGDGYWDTLAGAYRELGDLAAPIADAVVRREAPPVVFEVASALTVLLRAKDYAAQPIWNAALSLTDAKTNDDPRARGLASHTGLPPDPHEEQIALAEAVIALVSGDTPAERQTPAGTIPRAVPEAVRVVRDRTMLLGAGGSFHEYLRQTRPYLWLHRDRGPAWQALCLAFDAIGAGDTEALDELAALTEAHAERPSFVWLHEVACRVSGRWRRAARLGRSITKALRSGAFGPNAIELASGVEVAREDLGRRPKTVTNAWRRVSALSNAARRGRRTVATSSEHQRSVFRRKAANGDPRAGMMLAIDDLFAAVDRTMAEAMAREGPFYRLNVRSYAVTETMDAIAHDTVHGFRELYALELLRESLPRLADAAT